jgi:ATP-dependent Lon protease
MSFPIGFVPVLPLRNTVLYPGITQVLRVGREKSVKALLKAFENQNWIITTLQKKSVQQIESLDDIYRVGVLAKIESVQGNPESGYHITVRGQSRVEITQPDLGSAYLSARFETLSNVEDLDQGTRKTLLGSLKTISKDVLQLIPAQTESMIESLDLIDDLEQLVHLAATHSDFDLNEKQKILETLSVKDRVFTLLNLLHELKANLQVQSEIRQKLSKQFGKSHRQQILREQMKAIKEELGESESSNSDSYLEKIYKLNMPEEAMKLAEQQAQRLEDVNASSPEYQMIRNHLDFIVSLPWGKASEEKEIDLQKAREVLEKDHYGLETIKKRIIQHLSVLKLKKDKKGSILLFVGPPGVGKTSLGQSIAKALDKKYVRVSLGGVRDDAEIRGHRRTYVGALPGRILNGIKKAGENNPVFVLDEIDKMSRGFSGDPASAMLEVLDPEQNSQFMDHYLDIGYDLSKVFFIATANSLEGIPGPLLDRMEVIDVSGYTTQEKFHIAKNHLIPKQLLEHGISAEQIEIDDEVIYKIMSSYTREAGVRDLQRKIAQLLRSAAEKVIGASSDKVKISVSDLDELLGQERFQSELAEVNLIPGVATGLAWTPVGGDILFIESASMPGNGQLIITGQLGDVMKESAQIALSLLKSRLPLFGSHIDFSKQDIHIHVPAGSIPKDGPSAGVTMLSSMASLLTRTSLSPQLGMTGEISLRGSVMPVGGIKEKVIAAHRAGLRKIILPKKNEKDLKDVPAEVKADMNFVFVEHINEVLKIALNLNFDLMSTDGVGPFGAAVPPQLGEPAN